MARVSFVLPRRFSYPSGGFKVAYTYANGLARLGHNVSVVHPWHTRPLRSPYEWGRYLAVSRVKRSPAPWFDFDSGLRHVLIPWLDGRFLPRADVAVLTAYETVAAVRSPKRVKRLGQIVYDYEYWADGDRERRAAIAKAMRRPDVTHIATSTAVAGMLDEMGVDHTAPITAGVDKDRFRVTTRPESRAPVVGFALRHEPFKGVADLITALGSVRTRDPDATFRCFGQAGAIVPPDWVTSLGYVTDADLAVFYNRCSVFALPSHWEGWGLPAAEAMACGAAVVTTANRGTEDFAADGETALVVPPHRPEMLADAIHRLLADDGLRFGLAERGSRRAADMSWSDAVASLAAALQI